ncbi:MAG: hypothetical protein ACYDHY_17595 [Acidiferrobacterales bacterium]
MRARLLKPGLYKNDRLAELSIEARYAFPALWCLADRAGRLEDRPARIKAEVYPYDDVQMHRLLCELEIGGFIRRYHFGNERYIQIVNFGRHQSPHVREPVSTIPAPPECSDNDGLAPGEPDASTGPAPDEHQAGPAVYGNHVRYTETVTGKECAPAAPVAAGAAPAKAATPAKVPASETKPKAAPKPNKLSDVIDAIKDAGGEVTTSARDGKAVRECSAPAALIAEAYLAAASGAWGDDFTRRNLALWFVCSRIDGYRAHVQQTRASPGAGNGYESYDAGGGVLKVRQVNRFEAGTYGRLVQS